MTVDYTKCCNCPRSSGRVEVEGKPSTDPHWGIIDPDYARVFTKARLLAWSYGFACVAHGSFSRDLDLLLVPWADTAKPENAERIVDMLAANSNLKRQGVGSPKPHGRVAYTLLFPGFGDPRFVDVSVFFPAPPGVSLTSSMAAELAPADGWVAGSRVPGEPGIYQRDYSSLYATINPDCQISFLQYSYWTGTNWNSGANTESAAKETTLPSCYTNLPWRTPIEEA